MYTTSGALYMALSPPDPEQAEVCFELATGYSKGVDGVSADGASAGTLVSLFCERAACAAQLGSVALAANLLGRGGALLESRGPRADDATLHEISVTAAYINVGKIVYQQAAAAAGGVTVCGPGANGANDEAADVDNLGAAGSSTAAEESLAFFERAYDLAMRASAARAARAGDGVPPANIAEDLDGEEGTLAQDQGARARALERQEALAREEMAVLERSTLRCLACLHTQLGRNDAALRCISALRQLSSCSDSAGRNIERSGDGGGAVGEKKGEPEAIVSLLSVRALAGLSRMDEAEAAAMDLVSMPSAPTSMGWQAVSIMIHSGRFKGALRALEALETAHKDEVAELVAACVEALLKEEESAAKGGGSSGGAGELAADVASQPHRITAIADASTAAALAVRRNARPSANARHGSGGQASNHTSLTPAEVMWLVLWNGASGAFERKDYPLAMQLFEVADHYAGAGDQGPSRRADGFRARALCAVCTKQHLVATECLERAESLAPRRVTTGFLAAKVAIERADHGAARRALPQICGADDFDAAFLTLVAHEAMHADQAGVAADALESLLASVQRTGSVGGDTSGGPSEVAVLRNLIEMICVAGERHDSDAVATDAGGGSAGAGDGDDWMARVLAHLEQALARVRELGFRRFFGCSAGSAAGDNASNDESTANAEAAWFANKAWALARKASECDRAWARSSKLFAFAGDMLTAMPEDANRLRDAHAAFLLAAAAALQAHGAATGRARARTSSSARLGEPTAPGGDGDTLAATNIANARGFMDKARRVATRAGELPQPAINASASGAITPLDTEELARSAAMLDFEIAACDVSAMDTGGAAAEARTTRMRAALAAASERGRAADADALLAMAALVTRGDARAPDVAVIAWRKAIDLLLRKPSPDYSQLASAYRNLIDLSLSSMDESGALAACREATRAAASARSEDTWPSEELEWLAVRSWNYGVGARVMGRDCTAKDWQGAAIAVVERSSVLEARFGDSMRSHYMDLLSELGQDAAATNAAAPMET